MHMIYELLLMNVIMHDNAWLMLEIPQGDVYIARLGWLCTVDCHGQLL